MLDEDRVFLETTRRLAPPSLALDDARSALELLRPALVAGARVLDLGCGYGRHLAALARLGLPGVLGVDRSALLLREANKLAPASSLVRGDLRALPLRSQSLDAAACFYSSMFLGTEADSLAALTEARRVLKPAGLLVLTTDNPLRLLARPHAGFQDELPGLGQVSEESAFDAATGVDVVRRRIVRSAGAERSEAVFRIRYYLPRELATLAQRSGLRLLRLFPDAELTPAAPQLIALLGRF